MKSNLVSKSETNSLLKEISTQWVMEIPKIKNLKMHHIEEEVKIITGDGLRILKIAEDYFPFLSETDLLKKFPYVMVDMGAVKFMCNGANVMRPGIKSYSEFEEGQIVCVIEESHHKFLAVGKSIVSSNQLESIQKGEVVKNCHYISDKYWEIGKTVN